MRPGGSQSPEGQTGTEVYERGGFSAASFRFWALDDPVTRPAALPWVFSGHGAHSRKPHAASFLMASRFQGWAGPPFPYLRWSGPIAGRGGQDDRLVSFQGSRPS